MPKRLGIVNYSNVAPLHYKLTFWEDCELIQGVPTELNKLLLAGKIDLTLISSIEFLRHRHILKALPDFGISTLGEVYSVMLFHWQPWEGLGKKHIAVSTDSATSVELLKILLADINLQASFVPMNPNLDNMLSNCDAALLIGDIALIEAVKQRKIKGQRPFITDLGKKWFDTTKLPFTFAVWAAHKNNPPLESLVANLRAARARGLENLREISKIEAQRLQLPPTVVESYLSNFRYNFEKLDHDGLIAFAEKSIADFKAVTLQFWDI